MRLRALEIECFRGYGQLSRIDFGDFTTIVGRNDVGKSTIMDALDLFFDDKKKATEDDLCVYGQSQISVTAEFCGIPSELVLDSTALTSLHDEEILYSTDVIRIKKIFLTKGNADVFLDCYAHLTSQGKHLIQLKRDQLKSLARELGVEEDVENKTVNASWRKAIRQALSGSNPAPVTVALQKDDAKDVWEKLRAYLPIFSLFKVDRETTDQDSEATNPLKIAIDLAIAEVEAELETIKRKVVFHAQEVINRTIEKTKEMDYELAVALDARVNAEPSWKGFKIGISTDNGVPLNKRGSGTKRIVLLNFFRAEAERRQNSENKRNIVFAFEEPEVSQHFHHQQKLIDAFRKITEVSTSQIIVTTHSPYIVEQSRLHELRLVKKNSQKQPEIFSTATQGGETDTILDEIAKELGIRTDKRVKIFVCVEGPNDINFFHGIFSAARDIRYDLVDFTSDPRVALFFSGGSTLRQWIEQNHSKKFNNPEFHFMDRDVAPPARSKYQDEIDRINQRGDGSFACCTNKKELENYLHYSVINSIFKDTVFDTQPHDFANIPELVAQHIHKSSASPNQWVDLSEDKQKQKISNAKRRLNSECSAAMTPDLIQGTPGFSEILDFMERVSRAVGK